MKRIILIVTQMLFLDSFQSIQARNVLPRAFEDHRIDSMEQISYKDIFVTKWNKINNDPKTFTCAENEQKIFHTEIVHSELDGISSEPALSWGYADAFCIRVATIADSSFFLSRMVERTLKCKQSKTPYNCIDSPTVIRSGAPYFIKPFKKCHVDNFDLSGGVVFAGNITDSAALQMEVDTFLQDTPPPSDGTPPYPSPKQMVYKLVTEYGSINCDPKHPKNHQRSIFHNIDFGSRPVIQMFHVHDGEIVVAKGLYFNRHTQWKVVEFHFRPDGTDNMRTLTETTVGQKWVRSVRYFVEGGYLHRAVNDLTVPMGGVHEDIWYDDWMSNLSPDMLYDSLPETPDSAKARP